VRGGGECRRRCCLRALPALCRRQTAPACVSSSSFVCLLAAPSARWWRAALRACVPPLPPHAHAISARPFVRLCPCVCASSRPLTPACVLSCRVMQQPAAAAPSRACACPSPPSLPAPKPTNAQCEPTVAV
jgi:hypothetical protein